MSTGDSRRPCVGCGAEAAGLDRLEYQHEQHCPKFDAFYDASDADLAAMVPPGPDPTGHLPAMFEDARAFCLLRYNYTPEAYVSPEARERHIDNDARSTAAEVRFAMPWNAGYARGIAEGHRRAAEAIAAHAEVAGWGEIWAEAVSIARGES